MDLSDIKVSGGSQEGARLDIRHPATDALLTHKELVDGVEVVSTFHLILVGKYSKQYIANSKQVTDRRLKNASNRKKVTVTSDQLEMEEIEMVSKCTTGGFIIAGGKKLDFNNFDAVYEFYANPEFKWLKDLAIEFVEEDSNFLKS